MTTKISRQKQQQQQKTTTTATKAIAAATTTITTSAGFLKPVRHEPRFSGAEAPSEKKIIDDLASAISIIKNTETEN